MCGSMMVFLRQFVVFCVDIVGSCMLDAREMREAAGTEQGGEV